MATTSRNVLLCYCTFEDTIIGVRVDSQTDFNDFVDEVYGGLKVHANSVTLHYTTHLNKTCFLPLNGPRDLSNLLEFNNEKQINVETQPSPHAHIFNISNHANLLAIWEHEIIGVGQTFDSGDDFRNALNKFSIARIFAYKFLKNDREYIQCRCAVNTCGWEIRASAVSGGPTYRVYKYNPIHTHSTGHAISLTYKQAWRGKKRFIPWLCKKLIDTNSRIVATFTVDDSVGCHPMLSIDANNQMFPIAFAVVSSESIPDWTWSLENLKIALNDDWKVIIVSDHNTSIRHAVETVFDSKYHSFCSRHLMENLKGCMRRLRLLKFKKEVIEDYVNQLIYTRDTMKFDLYLSKIHNQNLDIYGWIMDSDPPHWANSLFKCRRYDKFTSNLVESFNAWVLEAREQPIMSLLNIIRLKMIELTFKRQCEAKGYKQPVGPNIEDFLKFKISESINLGYMQCGEDEFEIRYMRKQEIQMVGLPCVHACRAIGLLGLNIYDFAIYSEHIHAMPNSDMSDFSNESVSFMSSDVNHNVVNLLPPKQKRQPGRPKTKRIESQPIERREIHCSWCGESSHYRRTCRPAID
uniref:Uncharacterized protein n=1 Tax=Nelumbo nucifera TaxID=4432 RepID=A0A822XN78_NELNU|nr:TPA_asm: hypothetical protein HUJ06_023180 [Nelumbo nucifera]